MPDSTLPAGLVLRLATDLLAARADRLAQQMSRANPHGAAPSAAVSRQALVGRLRAAVRVLRAEVRGHGEVSAATAGLLLAWAGGHQPALVELEDLDERVARLESEDYVGAARLLLGAREE